MRDFNFFALCSSVDQSWIQTRLPVKNAGHPPLTDVCTHVLRTLIPGREKGQHRRRDELHPLNGTQLGFHPP